MVRSTGFTSSKFFFFPLFLLLLIGTGTPQAQTIPEGIDSVAARSNILDNVWGVLVEDEDGSTVYYDRSPGAPLIPASNMKIFTTAAAYELLGTNYVFETNVYYTGTLSGTSPNRTVSGDLVIVVEHDPTWNTSTLGSGNARAGLNAIASRVRNQHGIASIQGRVICRGAADWGQGGTGTAHWNWTSTQTARNQNVASALRSALIDAGVSVPDSTTVGTHNFDPPPGGTQLFTHRSDALNYHATGQPLTLDIICRPLNKVSHNSMADLMLRHIGWKLDTQSPPRDWYSVGGDFVIDWMQNELGIDTTGISIADGSGISTGNRFTTRQTIDVTRYMVNNHPRWNLTLPISGVDGTLSSRLGGQLAGRVRAKTGTLPNGGVVTLSGYVSHPLNERRYYFSIYANRPGGSINVTATRDAIDDMVREFGLVWPPIAPDLYAVRNQGDTVRVSWTDNALVTEAYRLYASDDSGDTWSAIHDTDSAYIIETRAPGLNNADYTDTAGFENSTDHSAAPGLTPGIGSRFIRPTSGAGTATFTPSGMEEGRYRVDVTCVNFSSSNAPNARATIVDALGSHQAHFDLSNQTAGSFWRSVGIIDFVPGQNHRVEFTNAVQATSGSNDRMNLSAVRFVPMYYEDEAAPVGGQRHYRLVSVAPGGGESEDSNVYSAGAGLSPRILVIDNHNRWRRNADQNPGFVNHDFSAVVADSIPVHFPFDMAADEAVEEQRVPLGDYDVLVWNFGEEGSADRTFNDTLQTLTIDYLNAGGHLFVNGAEIGWDLARTAASESDKQFFENVLRAARFTSGNPEDNAQTYTVNGTAGNIFDGIGTFNFADDTQGPYDVRFPDILNPVNGSAEAMTYIGGRGGPAAITYDSAGPNGKLVFMGFPFETILDASVRDESMERILDFFGLAATGFEGWILLGN